MTVDVARTDPQRFAALPDYPFAPRFHEHDGVRMAWVQAGPDDGEPVWLQHGEPTWGFLWRHVVPPLVAAGKRCLMPDLVGFGRSDKPTDLRWYTYERHVEHATALLEHLDLRGAAMVVHDWGGPIGMRLFAEHPDRFAKLAVLDTGFFTGEQRMTDAWIAFRDFVQRTEDLPIGFLVNGACTRELAPEELAAYEAPFPTPAHKAGARAFPLILPTRPDAPGAEAGRALRDAMVADDRPVRVIWGGADPIIPPTAGERIAELLGAPAPDVLAGASHFLQEDAGPEIGALLAGWL